MTDNTIDIPTKLNQQKKLEEEINMNKHEFALQDYRGVCAKCGIIAPKDSQLECGRK